MNHCTATPSAFNDLDDHGVFVLDLDPVSLPAASNKREFTPVHMSFPGHLGYNLHVLTIERSSVSFRLRCVVQSFKEPGDMEAERIEMCLLHKFRDTLHDRYHINGDELVMALSVHGAPIAVIHEARADLGLPCLTWLEAA